MGATKAVIRYHQMEEVPMYLSAKEIVQVLGISRSNVYDIMHSIDFPLTVVGGRRMVQRERFFKWLKMHDVDNSIGMKCEQSNLRQKTKEHSSF